MSIKREKGEPWYLHLKSSYDFIIKQVAFDVTLVAGNTCGCIRAAVNAMK